MSFTKQELEDGESAEITVEAARELVDLDLPENLATALDNAQGKVFTNEAKSALVVIRITS